MNPLDKVPLDKSHHAIGGALVGTVASLAAVLVHQPAYAWQAAVVAALLAGVGKEIADARANIKATGKWRGDPVGTPHGVEGMDALATLLGAFPVAAPLLVQALLGKGP